MPHRTEFALWLAAISVWISQPLPAASQQQRSTKSQFSWTVTTVEDRMTNERHPEASLVQRPSAGSPERLEVKGTCGRGGMDWLIAYFSGTSTAGKLQLNYPSNGGGVRSGLILGGVAGVTIGTMINLANSMRPTGPFVSVRVKIDNNSPVTVPSYTQYNNAAILNFPPRSLTDGTVNASDRLGHDLNVLDQDFHPRAAMLEEIEAAGDILVELPREDGSPIYLEVKTHDPGFQQFVSVCSKSMEQAGSNQGVITAYMQEARTLMAPQPLPWSNLQSAYCDYKKVLKLDPNNREASVGVIGAETRVRDRLEFGMIGIPIGGLSCDSDVPSTYSGASGGSARTETIQEFKSKLPSILRAAGSKYGLGPDGYSRELEYINRYLDTCVLSNIPPGTEPPSVNDPKYEICERQTGRTQFIGNSKDVSAAANNPHNPGTRGMPGRGDVLLYTGQQSNTPWQPGETNTFTISIFLPPNGAAFLGNSNFDELISKVDVKGRPSPDFTSASTAASDSKSTVRFYVGTIPEKHTMGVNEAAWDDALGNRHAAQHIPPKVIPISGDTVDAPHCSDVVQPAASATQGNQMRFAQVEFENETNGPLVLQKQGTVRSDTNLLAHSKIALSSESGETWTVVNQSAQCVVKFPSPFGPQEWNVVIPVNGLASTSQNPMSKSAQNTSQPQGLHGCYTGNNGIGGDDPTQVTFVNRSNRDRNLYVVDPSGTIRADGTVPAQSSRVVDGAFNWVWIVADEDNRCITRSSSTRSGSTITIPR